MKESLHIVKIGGNIINDKMKLHEALESFVKLDGKKILVHGGGKSASLLESRLGIDTKMIEGRRITDAASLEVVVMCYAGLINKSIVASLQANGFQSVGLTGADLNVILAKKREHKEIDFGFVGDVISVQDKALLALLELNIIPVVCAITHDGKGQLLNTNADTISSMLAQALAENYELKLRYIFEYSGVLKSLENPLDTFATLGKEEIEKFTSDGTLSSGMLPKIQNALEAKSSGVSSVSICSIENLHTQILATEIL